MALRIVPLCILLMLWIWFFVAEGAFGHGPNSKTFEADYAMFVGAAQVMKHGGNAYDQNRLYNTESTLLKRQGIPMTAKRSVVRVGNPLLFFWALQPISDRDFRGWALAWGGLLYLVSLLGFLAVLSYLGWRRNVLPTIIFMLMPQTVLAAFYGNPVPLIFAAFGASLLLLSRQPVLAGACLTLAWLKPSVALPFVALIVLFHTPARWRTALGFCAGTLAGVILTIVTTGPHSITQWIVGLSRYSRDLAESPSIASLSGLYVRPTSGALRTAIEFLVLAVACALTLLTWNRTRGNIPISIASISWLWVVWFLATPYAHIYDEMLLAIPVAASLGVDATAFTHGTRTTTLYLLFLSFLLIQAAPGGVQLLPIPIVGVALCLFFASRAADTPGKTELYAA